MATGPARYVQVIAGIVWLPSWRWSLQRRSRPRCGGAKRPKNRATPPQRISARASRRPLLSGSHRREPKTCLRKSPHRCPRRTLLPQISRPVPRIFTWAARYCHRLRWPPRRQSHRVLPSIPSLRIATIPTISSCPDVRRRHDRGAEAHTLISSPPRTSRGRRAFAISIGFRVLPGTGETA